MALFFHYFELLRRRIELCTADCPSLTLTARRPSSASLTNCPKPPRLAASPEGQAASFLNPPGGQVIGARTDSSSEDNWLRLLHARKERLENVLVSIRQRKAIRSLSGPSNRWPLDLCFTIYCLLLSNPHRWHKL